MPRAETHRFKRRNVALATLLACVLAMLGLAAAAGHRHDERHSLGQPHDGNSCAVCLFAQGKLAESGPAQSAPSAPLTPIALHLPATPPPRGSIQTVLPAGRAPPAGLAAHRA